MIGHGRHMHLARREMPPGQPILYLHSVTAPGDRGIDALRGLDLTLQPGEILGVAGVEGNGQRELAEAIIGLRAVTNGDVVLDGESIRDCSTIDILRRGVGFVPEDRHHDALVLTVVGFRERRFGQPSRPAPSIVGDCSCPMRWRRSPGGWSRNFRFAVQA